MEDKGGVYKKLRAKNFVENNGKTLQLLNFGRQGFFSLKDAYKILSEDGLSEQDFLDCVNFLQLSDYIMLRRVGSRDDYVNIADAHYAQLESKLTGTGIRLLQGDIADSLVNV